MRAKQVARETPDKILVIALDGSDQSSYGIPYFDQKSKSSVKGWRLPHKPIGSLVTGRLLRFFTIGSNFESGMSGWKFILDWFSGKNCRNAPHAQYGFVSFSLPTRSCAMCYSGTGRSHLNVPVHVSRSYRTGSNLTVEVIHSTLVALIAQQAEGVALPRTVHFQMDNCSRENENR